MLALASPASAQQPTGTIRGKVVVVDSQGNDLPVPQAVVFVEDFIEPFTPAEAPAVHQTNKRFAPNLLVVPINTPVTFPNDDPIDHNVFSVSPVKSFDLGLYGGGKAKTLTFDRPGPIRIYCNIHPQMIGDILVLPNRHHAVVGPDGNFAMEGVPAGPHKVRAWFAKGPSVNHTVDVQPGRDEPITIRLTQTVMSDGHLNKLGQPYPIKY